MTNNPTPLWWYSGSRKFVWCHVTNTFLNGQIVELTVGGANGGGEVSLYRPHISDFVYTPPAYPTNATDADGTSYLQLGDRELVGAMKFEVDIYSPVYDGEAAIVQLIERDASNGQSGLGTDNQYWLDSQFFYVHAPLMEPPDNIEYVLPFSDGPGIPEFWYLSTTVSISDHFIDYVVFRPNKGNKNENVFVTLGVVSGDTPSWSWSATSSWYLGWSLTAGSTNPPAWPDNRNAFPIWPHTWKP